MCVHTWSLGVDVIVDCYWLDFFFRFIKINKINIKIYNSFIHSFIPTKTNPMEDLRHALNRCIHHASTITLYVEKLRECENDKSHHSTATNLQSPLLMTFKACLKLASSTNANAMFSRFSKRIKWNHYPPTKMCSIRRANIHDILSIQNANLHCLPENYQRMVKYYL